MNAQVAVFGFTVLPDSYTYTIPAGLTVAVGQVVEVPFGKTTRRGVVTEVSSTAPAGTSLKPIGKTLTPQALVTPQQLSLAQFISERYFISLAEALALMLPRLPRLENLMGGRSSQELLLFPTLRQAAAAQKMGGGLLFSHALKAQEFTAAWQEVVTGKARRILGPRTALFAPFRHLKQIYVFQTESEVYKEERRPYYRTLPLSQELAKIFGAKLSAVSFSPRIQDEFTIPHVIKKLPPEKVHLVDLRHDPIINGYLRRAMTGSEGQRILLFLNRKSEKGPLRCRVCKEVTYTSDPSTCPSCGSADVKFQTFNLQTLAKKFSPPAGSDVTLATQQILFEDVSPFDLVVILSADTFLHQPSFNSAEKTFQMITSLRRLLKPNGRMILQTGFPDEPAIKLAVAGDYRRFYRTELKLRQETANPPFSQIVKVTPTGKAAELPDLPDLDVFGPFPGKKPYYIVRGKNLLSLKILPRSWKLDLDPLRL